MTTPGNKSAGEAMQAAYACPTCGREVAPTPAAIAARITSEEVAKKALMAFWEYDANGDMDAALRVAAEAVLKMETKP